MSSIRWRMVSWPILMAAFSAPVLVNCKGLPGGLPGPVGDLANAGSCSIDVTDVDAIAKADWAGTLGVNAEVGGKIKGGLQAAVNLQKLAADIDAQVKGACANLASDLGASGGDYKDATAACQAAIKVMGDVKAKMGASASISIDIVPPKCSASMSAMADCAGHCDASASGGKAEVKCTGGDISGQCDANCTGSCDVSAGGACDGTCSGTCDGDISGTCKGNCTGKCDGKTSKGAQVSATCKGQCKGSCQLKAAAKCSGTCSGTCSVDFKAPKCSGTVEPPKVSAECKASCNASVSGKVDCTPATVALKITGSADADAAAKFKAAVEKNLPAILKVAIGLKDRLGSVATSGEAVITGVQSAASAAVSGGGKGALKIAACTASPFKGAIDAVASVKASVNVSVDVKASASAGGSAKAGG